MILHMVTWYPVHENDIDGIFIRRQIELLAADKSYNHVIVQHSSKPMSIWKQVKGLAGIFNVRRVGHFDVVELMNESTYNKRIIWRYKKQIWRKQLSALIKSVRPSLLHLHEVYGFAKEAVAAKENWNIPFVVTEHMAPFPFPWIQDKETYIKKPLQLARSVIAVGQAQAQQILDFTGVRATIIPNVVNSREFHYADKKQTDEQLHFVLVGIYDSRKGADYLLQTLPAFFKIYPQAVLHLVGDASPERMKHLKELAERGGIKNEVQFHGKLTAANICKLYHQCDFYVCSSEWESFGVSVLEALFTGLPVLSTNCGGVLEFMNETNGLLISNDRQQQTLLNGLVQMAATCKQYNRKQIAEQVHHHFSEEYIQQQYLDIYKNVLRTQLSAA